MEPGSPRAQDATPTTTTTNTSWWRRSFDQLKETDTTFFRAPDAPIPPVKQQMCSELKNLARHPFAFTQGNKTWREIYATSSVRCIPAAVLLIIRWLFFAGQVTVLIYSFIPSWTKLYFFTSWTNILVALYYLMLSLCSTVAFLVKPRPVNPEITGKNMLLTDPAKHKSVPFLLRPVEAVSSVVLGASFVTCVVYWAAMYPTGEHIGGWMSYVEHFCFVPVCIMALISRIPYRLQHLWVSVLYALSYCALCVIVASVPLVTWKGRVGYIYNALQYRTQPILAWLITAAFTVFVAPLSHLLFWFIFRSNNPAP